MRSKLSLSRRSDDERIVLADTARWRVVPALFEQMEVFICGKLRSFPKLPSRADRRQRRSHRPSRLVAHATCAFQ